MYNQNTQAITNKKVNNIFLSIINYYKLSNNLKKYKYKLFYIFSHSLAKMYAAKHKIHKKTLIFKIGGNNLN